MNKIFFTIIYLCVYVSTHQIVFSQKNIPVFDLSKKYPSKKIEVNNSVMEYIPLETTAEVLADGGFSIKYVSDNRIVGVNKIRGDIFVFDRSGKVISFFNHKGKGGVEYFYMMSIVYDEANQEIFVADIPTRNRCAIYSEDGKFLRQFNFPANSWIGDLYNFDDQTLLAYNHAQGFGFSGLPGKEDINQKMPYVFLSKKDGRVVSRLRLSFPERNSETHVIGTAADGSKRTTTISIPYKRVKYGREFIIADMSSDTVFILTQDKRLTPLFVRSPSVFNDGQLAILHVYSKINHYLFFGITTYSIPKVVELKNRGQSTNTAYGTKLYVYDMSTNSIYMPVGIEPYSLDIDAPENTCVQKLPADLLVELLDRGRLNNNKKKKEVAQTLKEEDNPVVEIIKYR